MFTRETESVRWPFLSYRNWKTFRSHR